MLEWILLIGEARAAGAEIEYVPVVSSPPSSFPRTLIDVASRLPLDTDAREPDLVTYAHEASHFLCRGREGCHGIYVTNGLRIYIPTPPLLTEDVFQAIPAGERGPIWNTYRDQGRSEYWAAQPLMLLDEWTAYLHGSMARGELGLTTRRESDVYCAEMARYVHQLYVMAERCPDYPINELKAFLVWNDDRCRRAIPDWGTLFTKKFK
jgi:hypothetical protein